MTTVDPLVARLWFESVDADSSGFLDAKELKQALDIGGLSYSLAQVHMFIRAFDSKGNNKLDVNEFVELHRFLDGIQTAFTRARSLQHLNRVEVQDALTYMGTPVHSTVSPVTGFTLDSAALQAMLARHDIEGRGFFGVEPFMQMCLFLLTASRVFRRFDPSSSGCVTLGFNQFCYAAAYLA